MMKIQEIYYDVITCHVDDGTCLKNTRRDFSTIFVILSFVMDI